MIIENILNKEQMEKTINLAIKYSFLKNNKIIIVYTILMVLTSINLIIPLFKKFEIENLIIVIAAVIVLIILYYKNSYIMKQTHKVMDKQNEEVFKEFNFVGRKYIFNERSLNVEIQNISNNKILKFDFNKYYKMWILNKTNTVVIQFNKVLSEKIFVVIYDVPLSEFKNYCAYYQIKYKNVSR